MFTLQYGQCGNQIGQTLYSTIYKDLIGSQTESIYYHETVDKWFNVSRSGKWIPRSILIDTDSKTAPLSQEDCNVPYRYKYRLIESLGGSGNNFACGYKEHGSRLSEDVVEIVRKELEMLDGSCTFLNIFSCSGGTGSGVGTAVTEALKSTFPKQLFVNVLLMPFFAGEIAVQSYNTVLAFAKIASVTDAIIYFENDRLHYTAANLLNIKEISFNDMNSLVVQQLLGLYQPIKNGNPAEILSKLTAKSSMKCIQIKSSPYGGLSPVQNWKSHLTLLAKQSRFDVLYKIKYQSDVHVKPAVLNMALICRGGCTPTQSDLKQLNDLNAHVSSKENLCVYHQPRRFLNGANHLTFVANTNSVCFPLNIFLKDATNLFNHGVYLHHYEKFGIDKNEFRESFETVRSIVDDYKNF